MGRVRACVYVKERLNVNTSLHPGKTHVHPGKTTLHPGKTTMRACLPFKQHRCKFHVALSFV